MGINNSKQENQSVSDYFDIYDMDLGFEHSAHGLKSASKSP